MQQKDRVVDTEYHSTPSMSSNPSNVVVSLSSPSDVIDTDRILVIIRNMAGKEMYLAVKKIVSVYFVRSHVSQILDRLPEEIKLMLDYQPLNLFTKFHEIQTLLETNGNVIHLLIEEREKEPQWDFLCYYCKRECTKSESVEWDPHPEFRCRNCANHRPCCYMPENDDE